MENPSLNTLLTELLSYVAKSETSILIQRNKLNQLFCFDTKFGYFKYLDKNRKGYIEYEDLASFLSVMKVKFTVGQLKQIIKNFDHDKDHCWNFEEFSTFIKPSLVGNIYNANKIKINELDYAVEQYEKELANLFKLEIEYIQHAGIKIKSIKSLWDNNEIINTKKIFTMLTSGKKSVDVNSLNAFMKIETVIDNSDLKNIIKRISNSENIDTISYKKLDEFFSYDKFIKEGDTAYVRPKGYYKTNPIDNSNTLYYTVYSKKRQNDSYVNPSALTYSMKSDFTFSK